MTTSVVSLLPDDTLAGARAFLVSGVPGARHQAYPLVDKDGILAGIVTRTELLDPARKESEPLRALVRRPPPFLPEGATLRQVVDQMARTGYGIVPVVADGRKVVGIVSRTDVLAAEAQRIDEMEGRRSHAATATAEGGGHHG
jgi:CBS domain-containing protein